MILKLKIFVYYFFIAKLPHSRLTSLSNRIRVWYVSRVLGIMPYDRDSKFEYDVYISDSKRITLGNNVRINENVLLQGDVEIGNFVMIAPNVAIHSSTHIYKDPSVPMVLNGLTSSSKVVIEDDVWIGRNSVVLPGIRIGKGSIIGANSLVNKDVEAYSIVGGVPARLIKKRL